MNKKTCSDQGDGEESNPGRSVSMCSKEKVQLPHSAEVPSPKVHCRKAISLSHILWGFLPYKVLENSLTTINLAQAFHSACPVISFHMGSFSAWECTKLIGSRDIAHTAEQRRKIDVLLRYDRFQCKVLQYGGEKQKDFCSSQTFTHTDPLTC